MKEKTTQACLLLPHSPPPNRHMMPCRDQGGGVAAYGYVRYSWSERLPGKSEGACHILLVEAAVKQV